jgi:hypothetical protein
VHRAPNWSAGTSDIDAPMSEVLDRGLDITDAAYEG